MLISTVIPVYNASKYLYKCLDSLINARAIGMENEILLINDGSTDDSLVVCEKYAAQYSFVKVFNQKNQGPSAARNLGIKQAIGQYLTFVDSDDFVSDSYYKTIRENLSPEVDVLIFGYYKINKNSELNYSFGQASLDKKAINHLISVSSKKMSLFWYPWTKVYRKEIIESIRFNEKINIGEDTIFNLEVFAKSNFIKIIDSNLYYYVTNEDSLTQANYRANLMDNMMEHYKARLAIHSKALEINTIHYFGSLKIV